MRCKSSSPNLHTSSWRLGVPRVRTQSLYSSKHEYLYIGMGAYRRQPILQQLEPGVLCHPHPARATRDRTAKRARRTRRAPPCPRIPLNAAKPRARRVRAPSCALAAAAPGSACPTASSLPASSMRWRSSSRPCSSAWVGISSSIPCGAWARMPANPVRHRHRAAFVIKRRPPSRRDSMARC